MVPDEGAGQLPSAHEPSADEPSPQDVATAWVEAVMDQADLDLAWPLTEPILRLVLAQDWVWTNRHRPDIGHDHDWNTIARGLAACPPAHPLWDAFAHQVLDRWHRSWAGFSTLTWRAQQEPEVVGLDTEMVTFVERDGWPTDAIDPVERAADGREVRRRFAMRHREGRWMVASVSGGQMFVPGWPPSPGA